jgi:hypothetical protein
MKFVILLAAWGIALGASAARADAQANFPAAASNTENANVEKFQRQLDQFQYDTATRPNTALPAGRRALVDYGAYLTFNYLSADDPNSNNHGLREVDLVGYTRINIDGAHEFFGRGKLSYFDFNPGDSFDAEGDNFDAQVERAYYRFDLQRALAAYSGIRTTDDLIFTGGRQFIYWANGLVLSQTIDGILLEGTHGPFELQGLAGVTDVRTVDFDSSRPNFDDHTLRGFYGLLLTAKIGEHRPFIYGLVQQDYNHGDVLTSGPITTHFHYDSHYIGAGSSGSLGDHLLYTAEGVYEGGHGKSNSFSAAGGSLAQVVQDESPIEAYAADARLDWVFNDPMKARIGMELTYATGDRDRQNATNTFGGNRKGSRDHAFNAFGLINTGLAFAPAVSNIYVLRTGGSMFPLAHTDKFKNLQVGTDLFFYRKADESAPIDEPSGSSGFLGVEPDVFLNWQIRSDVTLALRYGAFFPYRGAIGNNDVRQFFYAGMTFGL